MAVLGFSFNLEGRCSQDLVHFDIYGITDTFPKPTYICMSNIIAINMLDPTLVSTKKKGQKKYGVAGYCTSVPLQ